jgi:hypothetical protein
VKAAAVSVTIVVGTLLGLLLAWLTWVAASPHDVCASPSLAPGAGPCRANPPFLPFALGGIVVGIVIVAATLFLLARSLDD